MGGILRIRKRYCRDMRRLLLVLSLAAFSTAAGQERLSAHDSTILISFLDVGQGDAVHVVVGGRKQILIDAGPGRAIERRLWENGFGDTLDLLVATHAHDDHIGGVPWVFGKYVVRAYMDNGIPHTTGSYANALAALSRETGVQYLEASERTVNVGRAALRILPPPRIDAGQNDNSVGILLEFGKFRALFTGDSQDGELRRWAQDKRLSQVHVLKAAHHGSHNGFTPELAQLTRPRVVVISAGKRNGYGHPSPTVIQSWRGQGADVYSTHVRGTVTVKAKLDGTFEVVSRGTLHRELPR